MSPKKIVALQRLRKALHLNPQQMAKSLSMSKDSYGNLESGRRHLYVSDLLRLHASHGITPNDVLLPDGDRAHFATLAALRPQTATVRAMVARYSRLPAEMRKVVDRLADALYRLCRARNEIDSE